MSKNMCMTCVITTQVLPSSGGLHVEFTSWLSDVFLNISLFLLWSWCGCFFKKKNEWVWYVRYLVVLCVCCWNLPLSLTAQVAEWLRTQSLKAPRVLPPGSWPFIPQKRSSETSTDTLHTWSRRGLTEPAWLRLVYKMSSAQIAVRDFFWLL